MQFPALRKQSDRSAADRDVTNLESEIEVEKTPERLIFQRVRRIRRVTQGVNRMTASILPFSLDRSKERLTDRGSLAMVDEYAEAIGLPEKVDGEFPPPGSNRGIAHSAYVRTLTYHFSEGGRHIEEFRRIKADRGVRALIDMDRMPGPDAVGDWLRRMGSQGGQETLRCCNDMAAMTCWSVATCRATQGRATHRKKIRRKRRPLRRGLFWT